MERILDQIANITEEFPDTLKTIQALQPYLDFIVSVISILGPLLGIVVFMIGIWKKVIKPKKSYAKFVDSVYSKEIRKESLKYYIPTRAQDIDPCEYDEIIESSGGFISCLLIPFFIKEAFKESSRVKYYLVLADSGMGKTTFLLRLYRECLNKFYFSRKRNVELVPLANPGCLQKIQEIVNHENTILLLDALDENSRAMSNCDDFFESLIQTTADFYKVVITCRTQFFPERSKEPSTTGIIQIGKNTKAMPIVKKYLTPFNDDAVRLYLKKRFRFKKDLQNKAFEIVSKVPEVMARPLILNWINYLCDNQSEYKYLHQIYDVIIQKWIERETLDNNERNLYEFSCAIARYMLDHETTTISEKTVTRIASQKNINLEPIVAKSRSLLNRNGSGEYRFAHRSFLEYFIVFGILSKMKMPESSEILWSIGGAKRFLLEILLSSAVEFNPDQVSYADQKISEYQEYTGSDSVASFIMHPKLQLSYENSENGFTIEAWLPFISLEGYDRNGIFNVNKFFASTEGPVHCTTQTEGCDIGLILEAERKGDDLHTSLHVNVKHEHVALLV